MTLASGFVEGITFLALTNSIRDKAGESILDDAAVDDAGQVGRVEVEQVLAITSIQGVGHCAGGVFDGGTVYVAGQTFSIEEVMGLTDTPVDGALD